MRKKIKVLSYALFQLFIFSLLGLVAGMIYSFGGLIYDFLTTGLNYGTALAFLAIIGMPIISGIFGFFIGLIEALLYNFGLSKKFDF